MNVEVSEYALPTIDVVPLRIKQTLSYPFVLGYEVTIRLYIFPWVWVTSLAFTKLGWRMLSRVIEDLR